MVEAYLPASEVTVTVLPPGTYTLDGTPTVRDSYWALPPVERTAHAGGVAPYNGVVAVTANSAVVPAPRRDGKAYTDLAAATEAAAAAVGAVAPIRVDARADAAGVYRLFDLNLKPNMTGAGRPGRDDQDSLTAMAARAVGWSFGGAVGECAAAGVGAGGGGG
eukprot:TRINITY_DN4551_c0_g1_i3.p1 TRINITY_DN4551_c0_g1~~TRINITY_DN4551_c0_g1_i3.p1  ORF type:complete len:163 (-),score=51.44 TRINITY_DN4551_c0_g1_i3:231-719(-)